MDNVHYGVHHGASPGLLYTSPTGAWTMLAGLVATDGSAPHPHVVRLFGPRPARRDLSDAVHALCAVHGGHPGMIDEAAAHSAQPAARDWLTQAASAFAGERVVLVQLAAAVGPLPSTPGQAETGAALVGMRHALNMLAQSDRGGCATGAVAALVADWEVIRILLTVAAEAFGAELPASILPPTAVTAPTITSLGDTPATERAMGFGARQLLAQHRGLWSLLEARAIARDQLPA